MVDMAATAVGTVVGTPVVDRQAQAIVEAEGIRAATLVACIHLLAVIAALVVFIVAAPQHHI